MKRVVGKVSLGLVLNNEKTFQALEQHRKPREPWVCVVRFTEE